MGPEGSRPGSTVSPGWSVRTGRPPVSNHYRFLDDEVMNTVSNIYDKCFLFCSKPHIISQLSIMNTHNSAKVILFHPSQVTCRDRSECLNKYPKDYSIPISILASTQISIFISDFNMDAMAVFKFIFYDSSNLYSENI